MSDGQLTTHVLDTMHGTPAAGVRIELYSVNDGRQLVTAVETNADGRVGSPLLGGDSMIPGVYQLVFHTGPYFTARDVTLPDPPFLDQIVVQIGIASADERYHVPLLVSPWSYSTYRGS